MRKCGRCHRCLSVLLIFTAALWAQQEQPPAWVAAEPDREDALNLPRSSDPGKQPFLRYFVRDELGMWTSPFRPSSYSTRTFTRYVVPFTLINIALIATDRKTADALPFSEDQSRWSLRVSQIGAPYTLAGMSAVMYLVSRKTGDKKARETGFLGAEAIAHSQLLTLGLKYMTQRERPFDAIAKGHGGTGFFRGGDSFPSGHASGSFALATVFAYEYGREHKWVPWLAYGLASTVAASRMSAQKHWFSDVFTGGTMGFLVGRYVYRNRHDPRIDGYDPKRRTALFLDRLTPEVGYSRKTGGVLLSWRLTPGESR